MLPTLLWRCCNSALREEPLTGRRLVALTLTLMAVCMAWYVHFWPHMHTANESIRLYFAQAVAETGRPELDHITNLHGSVPVDRSEYGGHLYMDKAPGLSLMAIPIYMVLEALRPEVRHDELWLVGYICCLLLLVAPLLLGIVALGRWLRRGGASEREALLTMLAVGLGSPLLIYSTLLFGHGLAAALIMMATFWLRPAPPARAPSPAVLFGAGMAAGLAGFVDTPVFILAALLCLFVLARVEAEGVVARVRGALPYIAGVAIWSLAQLAYNHWTLGHPLRFTYQYKGSAELAAIIDSGFFGFRPPSLEALWGIWFGPARGLLYHAPWLAVGVLGLVMVGWRGPLRARKDARWLLGVAMAYSLLVGGFVDWRAGDSAAPRHLMPIVGLLAAGFVDGTRWGLERCRSAAQRDLLRGALAVALTISVVFAALPVMTFPYHFYQLDHPVLELNLPLLFFFGGHSHSLGNAMGWGHGASALFFTCLLTLPWWLVARWGGREGEPGDRKELRTGRALTAALLVAVVWSAVLVAPIQEPERTVQGARFKGVQLLLIPPDNRDAYRVLLRYRDD